MQQFWTVLGRILRDRGVWTSFAPMATVVISKLAHCSDGEALTFWWGAFTCCAAIDLAAAGKGQQQ
jgi:hypothetical protein